MASGGSGRRPGGDTPWWVTGIKVVAGIGAAAAGVYAAARAAEAAMAPDLEAAVNEEPVAATSEATSCSKQYKDEKDSDSDDDSDDDDDQWVSINDDDEYSDSSDDADELAVSSKPLGQLLHEHYQNKVKISDEEKTAVKAAADQVADSISEYFYGCHGNLLPGDTFVVGNMELAVQQLNRLVVLVPFELNSNIWKMVDADDGLEAYGYKQIQRTNLYFNHHGSNAWDRFVVESYLNPELIQKFLEVGLQKVANKGFTFDYDDCYVSKSDQALTLEIIKPVGGVIPHLTLHVIPSLKIEGAQYNFEGIPYGILSVPADTAPGQHLGDSPYDHIWYQSTRIQELQSLLSMDECDGGCRTKCLQILQAISLNQSTPLSLVSACQLQAVVFYLCEEEMEWKDVMIAERFIDLLHILESAVSEGLHHPYHTKINVFEGFSNRQCSRIKMWLEKRIQRPERLHALLM